MMRFDYMSRTKSLQLLLLIILLSGILGHESAFSDSSGLNVEIAISGDQSNLQIPLGFPIGLVMVITNETEWSLYTKKGFSQTEFYKSLHLTDPNGEKYIYIPEKETVDTMPPPIVYGDREVLLAEALLKGVVKTIVIDDLRELFPMLNTIPGWHTLEAIQPFVRFAEIIKVENFGVLGLADDENIWQGAVNSNKIQFYLYPTAGGQVNVQVLDGSVDPSVPLFQVPVKLFKSEDVTSSNSLEDAWSKAKPVLEGTTDNSGQTKWNSETTPCVIGDNYTVIAKYSDEYKDSPIASDDSGWKDGCNGLIEQTITFGEAPPPEEEIITISGSAYYYPEGGRYRASFSIDISTESVPPSGWLNYYYTKTRMSFSSSEITEVVGLNGNSASIRGKGTVNKTGSYTFEAVVVDGSPDSFGIIIKDQNDNIYYSATFQNISGGNLQVTIK